MKRLVPVCALVVATVFSITSVGRGKPPNPGIPVRVTIAGNANVPDGYKVVGDGREYVDGAEGVEAVINGSTTDFILDPTKTSVPAPRALWFDFTDKIANGTAANPWFGQGFVKLDTYVNIGQVLTVPVGATEQRYGGFGQIYNGTGKKLTMFRLVANPNPSAPNYDAINAPNFTSTIEVSHPDCNTWILTPKPVFYNDWGFGSGTGAVSTLLYFTSPTQSAGQYLMPFQMTLTRKTSITCP